jgi:hypothetical protein
MIRKECRDMDQREFWMKMNPLICSQTPIQSFFYGLKTLPVIIPSEGISSKPQIYHVITIYEIFKGTTRRAYHRSFTLFFSDWFNT